MSFFAVLRRCATCNDRGSYKVYFAGQYVRVRCEKCS